MFFGAMAIALFATFEGLGKLHKLARFAWGLIIVLWGLYVERPWTRRNRA